jgi:predicted nucleotidyltransferase
MKRARALDLLRKSKPELVQRFGVRRLALFGSIARDNARPESDVDVLVEFDGPANSARYFGLQFHLEDLFGWRGSGHRQSPARGTATLHRAGRGPCLSPRHAPGASTSTI